MIKDPAENIIIQNIKYKHCTLKVHSRIYFDHVMVLLFLICKLAPYSFIWFFHRWSNRFVVARFGDHCAA